MIRHQALVNTFLGIFLMNKPGYCHLTDNLQNLV